MRVATLQFSPKVGEIAANFSRAEALLMRQEREGEFENLDLLVLPELAFTGMSVVPAIHGRMPASTPVTILRRHCLRL